MNYFAFINIFYMLCFFFYNNILFISLHGNHFCLSLIIPATIEDINRCYNILKQSICNSISFPEEIVIVISGVKKNESRSLKKYINKIKKCTQNLIILFRAGKYNAASNRNYGFTHSNCLTVSYFDVDDIMSKYRILIIQKIFKENKHIDLVFHPSTKNHTLLDSTNLSKYYRNYVITNQFLKITNRCRKTFNYNGRINICDVSNKFYITNGWPSLKRSILNSITFNESLSSTEDLDFLSRVVAKGYKVALFTKPLGFYIKDFNCIT